MATEVSCRCGHSKRQHELTLFKCDNCLCHYFEEPISQGDMCVKPDPNQPPSTIEVQDTAKPVIVGIEWHNFQGTNELCNGILGHGAGSREVCNKPASALIHSDEKKPEWMKQIPNSGLKDSGKRKIFSSGMVRDTAEDKPRFDLVIPEGIPFNEQMLTRWAELLRKGAVKYSERNWEKAEGIEELNHAKASAFRHFMQWFTGETDEDHAAAVFFNITEVETIRWKQSQSQERG